ncbi:MMPL family transporter [Parachitinimonas caeni]|uniref:MMPL family transporter n=1 Tax=Parachitinimonas caeni TaxID=3031301 RepID=A0ABT7DXY5_9NEIS|nr:MMPL family transporter [Parachitinimonas caeni]MDK2124918.1 MMPL family transporter [Parachitinimonas caeni]
MIERLHPSRLARRLALFWLLLVLAIVGHNLWLWLGQHIKIDTDVLAMLPQDERNPAVQDATRRLADAAARRIVVLVGANDWPAAEKAGDAYANSLRASGQPLGLRYQVGEATSEQWLNFFSPYRQQLLTSEQRQALREQPPALLAQRAIEALYRPMGMPRFGQWQDDPLNLFGSWLTARAGESKVRLNNGRLALQAEGRHYAVLMLEQQGSAFSIAAQQALLPQLDHARTAALATGAGIEVLTVGIPLHAAAAARQAEREVHTIGIGSLIGIVVLTLFAFSALRPRLLVTLSIGVGLLVAISVCSLLFDGLHLITLVFGASLVGVAENYGTNYFSGRLGRPAEQRWAMLREQMPVMGLAMLTTVIGYALLALTPFPGLRQIAVFSASGLLAAFVTVLWWFPYLDKGEMAYTRLSTWLGSRRALWPTFQANAYSGLVVLVILGILLAGGMRLQANDDIRLLQNSPPDLIAQQLRVGKLLDLPGMAQFYLIQGRTEQEVLQREEALKAKLIPLVNQGVISGYQAVSDWLPSETRQEADAALIRQVVYGANGVMSHIRSQIGEDLPQPVADTPAPLTPRQWLASPVSEPLRHQWLGSLEGGFASVLVLRGLDHPTKQTKLAPLAAQLEGVHWVDKVGEVSSVMARYRHLMAWVIAISYLLVFMALSYRFGKRAWRALAPTALASVLTLALLSLAGQPLQLFNVLALLLILGMGVDYGIFLLEQPQREAIRPFLSITLAAASTLLAFGLLALSATPALRAFGLTMLFGIGLAWLLTPAFMPPNTSTTGKDAA